MQMELFDPLREAREAREDALRRLRCAYKGVQRTRQRTAIIATANLLKKEVEYDAKID